mmetsp:Transcript_47194/g.86626  ORF Transcript_47194/g.86626 Transcript_47194/m.86626 type:complete len:761 (-) Transcript_47194:306-2588(-)
MLRRGAHRIHCLARPHERAKATTCELSADIFPVCTNNIPVLARPRPTQAFYYGGGLKKAQAQPKASTLVASGGDTPAQFGTSPDLTAWSGEDWVPPHEIMGPTHLPGGTVPNEPLCDLAAQVLQHHSDLLEASRPTERTSSFAGYDVDLRQKFIFRGRPVEDESCVAVVVTHKAITPEGMTMSTVWPRDHHAASGVEVQVGKGGFGVIRGFAGFLGDGKMRQDLIGKCKSEEGREALADADALEPVWKVQFPRAKQVFWCIGSSLRPRLSPNNALFFDRLYGRGSSTHLARECIVRPSDRKLVVQEELDRIAASAPGIMQKLFGEKKPARVTSMPKTKDRDDPMNKLAGQFVTFEPPSYVLGKNKVLPSSSGSRLWAQLEQHGLYSLNPRIGRYIKLTGVLLVPKQDRRTPQLREKALSIVKEMASLLRKVGLTADIEEEVCIATSSEQAVDLAAQQSCQAVILCSSRGTEDWYHGIKHMFLSRKAPGLFHMASQWVNIERDHGRPAFSNCALQLLGKVGHSPYILSPSNHDGDKMLICGVDVCRMYSKTEKCMVNTFASLALRQSTGQVHKSWLNHSRVDGENIPDDVWKVMLKEEDCKGKDVVIHRDGRFTTAEKEFLMDFAVELGVNEGAFHLVELVKWAGGTPRLYNGTGNAPEGSFLRLSSSEGLLTCGSCRTEGTRNPLFIKVVGSPKLSLEALAEDVYRMTWLSYSNVYAQPRLPITTRAADKAAYFITSMDVDEKKTEPVRIQATGRQQYWL